MKSFAQFVIEDEHERHLKREVGAFFRANPHHREVLHDPEASKGRCDSMSKDLTRHLNSKGIKSHVQAAQGFKPELPDDAHKDWKPFKGKDQKFLWHAVVRSGKHTVDTTGSQYGKAYAGVRVVPHSEFKKDWKSVKPWNH